MSLCLLPMALGAYCQAADFRVLDFGDSCAQLIEQETRAGARFVAKEHSRLRFADRHLGRQADITYECPQGRFNRGLMVFRFQDFAAAQGFFDRHKADYIAYYGVPDLDQGSEIYAARMKAIGFEIAAEHTHLLGWERPDKNILFAASRAGDGSEAALVTIDIAPSQR